MMLCIHCEAMTKQQYNVSGFSDNCIISWVKRKNIAKFQGKKKFQQINTRKRRSISKAAEDFCDNLEFSFPVAVRQEWRKIKVNSVDKEEFLLFKWFHSCQLPIVKSNLCFRNGLHLKLMKHIHSEEKFLSQECVKPIYLARVRAGHFLANLLRGSLDEKVQNSFNKKLVATS